MLPQHASPVPWVLMCHLDHLAFVITSTVLRVSQMLTHQLRLHALRALLVCLRLWVPLVHAQVSTVHWATQMLTPTQQQVVCSALLVNSHPLAVWACAPISIAPLEQLTVTVTQQRHVLTVMDLHSIKTSLVCYNVKLAHRPAPVQLSLMVTVQHLLLPCARHVIPHVRHASEPRLQTAPRAPVR
jgi:hypothetical protein